MSLKPEDRTRLEDAIIVDEIGIESGSYGIYRLRSLYRPIFERRGQSLHPVAVEGTVSPYLAGEPVPDELFLTAAAEDDLELLHQIGLALPLRNHPNLEADAVRLLVDVAALPENALGSTDAVRFIADEASIGEMQPELVICAVGEPAPDGKELAALADAIRSSGMRSAIADFGKGRWSDEQMDVLAPDVARIDGQWFRQVCRDAVTIRLFESIVARLHERDVKVLVGGISDAQQLGIALDAGADLLQGDHLGPMASVGTLMLEAMPVRERLAAADKVRPLRAKHHQS